MTTYHSDPKTISSSEEVVFGILSDLEKLEKIKNRLTDQPKLKDLEFGKDYFSLNLEQVGEIIFKQTEKVAFSTIRYEATNLPMKIQAAIHLQAINPNETQMKLSVQANLPAMIKVMVGNKLEKALNKLGDMLAEMLKHQ